VDRRVPHGARSTVQPTVKRKNAQQTANNRRPLRSAVIPTTADRPRRVP